MPEGNARQIGRVCALLCLAVLLGGTFSAVSADGVAVSYAKRTLPAVKTTTPPTIDGDLSDPAWKTAARAEVFLDHQNGTPVADQTVAWLCYDDKYIYIAFACKDSQPDKIVARETVRDSKYASQFDSSDNEDNVEVVFDPFLAHRFEDLTRFSLNAIGCCSARLGGGRAGKAEWKGDWNGAVKRVADGWTAEMRIPWAILNYPSSKQPITLGVNFTRYQERTRIQSIWSNTGPQGFLEQEGRWKDVHLPAGAFHPHLSLLPYTLPGLRHGGGTYNSGLDARYTLTPELTAVGSINPDFATVEGAVQSIQFTRGEQFVPERRPFFLEGRDYFNNNGFSLIGQYFFSNSIPTFDFGSKIYGKITPADTLGFLHAIGFGRRDDLVARFRHDFSATSSASLFFLQKSAVDDNNTVGVLGHRARWGKLSIDSQWGLTSGHQAGGDAKQLNLLYEDKRVFWAFGYSDVSPLFRDADGFVPFTDIKGFQLFTDWGAEWRKGFWRNFDIGFGTNYQWHRNGLPYQRGINVGTTFETRNDWRVGLDLNYDMFDIQTDATVALRLGRGVSNRFRQWGFQLLTGKQGGRPSTFVGPYFSFRLFRKFDLNYNGAVQNLDGVTFQHIVSFNYELTPTRSFGGRLVAQSAGTNWYLFYRNSGAKGTEVYFILGDPNATRFVKRAAVKFVFAI